MSESLEVTVKGICAGFGNERSRMLDVVREIQRRFGYVSGEAAEIIARCLGTYRVEVASVVTFYAFLSDRPVGRIQIRLCNDVIDRLSGLERVTEVFEEQLGIRIGEITPDGDISLGYTSCIGMCDQAPAALINDVVVTRLSSDKVLQIVAQLKDTHDPKGLVKTLGDGNNAHELVRSGVENNIRMAGPVVLSKMQPGKSLARALALNPAEVIRNVKTARLRGRGGAGFPTGMKWEFTRSAPGDRRYIVCNADEGEPGTFKDRVILTEYADTVFEGMTVGGYAIGAEEGLLYLRGEYAYLRAFLEDVLARRRAAGLLGKDVGGKKGFSFDIRIQMGAGAYICGEETALLSSCEGVRGDPRNRPPFPAQKGYLGFPTCVNNVETFCCVARIMQQGPGWFSQLGSEGSSGTKLLSISGDCLQPGTYEVPFGIKLREVLRLAGAEDSQAVQVGGPSGEMVGPAEFDRKICYDDLATGGAIMVFGPKRNLLEVVDAFMEFFVEESCGYCTPCRVGNVLLKKGIEKILAGKGEPADLGYLEELSQTVKSTSRCGLGQTSAHPILSSLKHFRSTYESLVKEPADGQLSEFDLKVAVEEARRITSREQSQLKH